MWEVKYRGCGTGLRLDDETNGAALDVYGRDGTLTLYVCESDWGTPLAKQATIKLDREQVALLLEIAAGALIPPRD